MSTFSVRLVPDSGFDSGVVTDPSISNGVSIQRQMWVSGPNNTFRLANDGTTFTDSNYWKRYAPTSEGGAIADANNATVKVESDDGSPYSDFHPNDNVFVRVVDKTVTAGTTYTDSGNEIDILTDYNGNAIFVQIVTDAAIKVRFNGSTSADLDVASGTVTFDNGDLVATSLAFDNSASGASDATVQVMLTIRSTSNT